MIVRLLIRRIISQSIGADFGQSPHLIGFMTYDTNSLKFI